MKKNTRDGQKNDILKSSYGCINLCWNQSLKNKKEVKKKEYTEYGRLRMRYLNYRYMDRSIGYLFSLTVYCDKDTAFMTGTMFP